MRWAALAGLPLAFLGYFFVYPLLTVLVTGITGGDGVNPMVEIARRESLLGVAWFTLWQATASTALTLLVGIPGAYVLARYAFPGRRLVRALTIVPFVLPTVVVGTAFLALLGPGGVLGVDLSRTITAILLAHVFFNYAVVVRTVGAYWEQMDPRTTEAARMLGAGPVRTFREITLPLLAPAIASAASIVFLFTFTSFGIVLILGGLEHATLEVEIWRQATGLLQLPIAAGLATLQLVGVAAILWAYSRYQERRGIQTTIRPATKRLAPVGPRRWILGLNLIFMGVLLGTPIVVLVYRSLTPGGTFGFSAYTRLVERTGTGLFVAPTTAIANSVGFALVATVIAVVVGSMAAAIVAYRKGPLGRTFDALLMLPLGTSAVTLGFGFLLALDTPVDLRTSLWLIPIAHALVAIPFVVRTAVPVMRRVRTQLREAAMVLGASPARAWREIDLPIVARAVAVGAGFAVAISLGEFGATSFIARPGSPTLPIAIYRLLGQPGTVTFGRAMALSVVLMIITTAAVLVAERARPPGGEEL
jgi:thiamine transport system permease protein